MLELQILKLLISIRRWINQEPLTKQNKRVHRTLTTPSKSKRRQSKRKESYKKDNKNKSRIFLKKDQEWIRSQVSKLRMRKNTHQEINNLRSRRQGNKDLPVVHISQETKHQVWEILSNQMNLRVSTSRIMSRQKPKRKEIF